jgi:diguanylate cyclase (GGDEF)-like protein
MPRHTGARKFGVIIMKGKPATSNNDVLNSEELLPRAKRLRQIIWAAMVVLAVTGIHNAVVGAGVVVDLIVLAMVILGAALWIGRRGFLDAAIIVAVVTLTLLTTAISWRSQGIHDLALFAYPGILITSILLMKGRFFLLLLALMGLSAGIIVYTELAGLATVRRVGPANYGSLVDFAAILGATAFVTWILASDMRRAALKAREEAGNAREAREQINLLANYDSLTGLPNHLLAKDHMAIAMSYADRAHTKAALMLLDLDKFKTINDSLGHAIGDALLKSVAESLRVCLRDIDTLSRQGGDEFMIVLPEVEDSDSIVNVTEKILETLTKPFIIGQHHLSTSISIGIAVYPDDGNDFETLFQKADTAMYQAKAAGGSTYKFNSDQMNAAAIAHLHVRNGLRQALDRGEFVLHFQPQVNLASGAVIGAEALIRWMHPEFGMLPPSRFIPIAEETGLIVPIGDWVLREACREAATWVKHGHTDLVVAVNLSATQLQRGNLEKNVAEALIESGLYPGALELELTESILIHDAETVLSTMQRLKALGVKLSIDDFGTGYSSLSYLKRFDLDRLKIDRSFVRAMVNNPSDAVIVRTIIQMAQSLNLKTVAEGVEDEQQSSFLKLQHCEEAQGFLFSQPMSANDFSVYLANKKKEHI